jgi:hypothetical protein
VRELERLDGRAGGLADDVELALQRVGHDDVGAAADEDLADHRLLGAHGGRHRHVAVTGTSRQPSSTWPSALTARSSSCSQARREACSLGRKIMPTPYSPGGGSVDALGRHLGAVELVGDLDQDAGAVAHQLVGTHGAAVVEVLEDLQALLDDACAAWPLMWATKPTPQASCSLRGVVQALVGQRLDLGRGGAGWWRHGSWAWRAPGRGANGRPSGASLPQCSNAATQLNGVRVI